MLLHKVHYVFGASGAVGALIWCDSSTRYFVKTFPRFAATLTRKHLVAPLSGRYSGNG